MALTYIGTQEAGCTMCLPGTTTVTTVALDSPNDQVAWIFHVGRADGSTVAIEKVGITIPTGGAHGTPPSYTFSIQGVTAVNKPDGTIKGSGNSAYVTTSTFSAGYNEFSLGTPYVPSAGENLALVVTNAAADGSNYISLDYAFSACAGVTSAQGGPYATLSTDGGSTWSTSAPGQKFVSAGVRLNSAASTLYVPFMLAYESIVNEASGWISSGNPLYKGVKWTPPYGCRLIGARIGLRFDANADFHLELYEGTGTSPVLSRTIIGDATVLSVGGSYPSFIGLGPYTISQGTVYRLVLEPTTTTAVTGFYGTTFDNDDALTSFCGKLYRTTSPSSISWTDYDNGVNGYQSLPIVPVIDQIDVAGSSGGGLPILGGSILR